MTTIENFSNRENSLLEPSMELFDLPSVEVHGRPNAETCRLADSLWPEVFLQLASWKCEDEKRQHWQRIVHSCRIAFAMCGSVRFHLNRIQTPRTMLDVIEAAHRAYLLTLMRSKPGGVHSSRLFPTTILQQRFPNELDPWTFDPPDETQYVLMQKRNEKDSPLPAKKRRLSFDRRHPIAAHYQKRLALVDEVIRGCAIFWQSKSIPYDCGLRRLRPIHTAIFHPNWCHGRLYTLGPYGHTNLSSKDRQRISFNGEPRVELDYSAMHPRMLYHLRGIDFQDDPYNLWGDTTTPEQRKVAKFVLNSAVNAKNARLACHCRVSLNERCGRRTRRKRGRALEGAKKMQAILKTTGLSFPDVYELALKSHGPISAYFGTGAGAELMRLDSAIALDVLYHFAQKCIPALGVHDSFIVPKSHRDELEQVMEDCYRARLGFLPVVK